MSSKWKSLCLGGSSSNATFLPLLNPLSQEKTSVEKENLTNPRSRKYVSGFDCVIRTAFSPMLDQNNQPLQCEAKCLEMIGINQDLMGAARREEDFSEFHDLCSSFMEKGLI